MATRVYTYKSGKMIATLTTASKTITGSTFTFPLPTMTFKHLYSGRIYGRFELYAKLGDFEVFWQRGETGEASMPYNTVVPVSVWSWGNYGTTSNFFTASNNTVRTVAVSLTSTRRDIDLWEEGYTGEVTHFSEEPAPMTDIIYLTLDVPPAITGAMATYSTPQYTGLGTYSVAITKLEAFYGGNVKSLKLTVGSQSVTQSYSAASVSNATISLTPAVAGTFTPTLTVTDSRGQTKTVSLTAITVNVYNAPTVNFDVFRSDSDGLRADEGHFGLITARITYTGAVANLNTAPSVKINGTSISDYYAKTLDTSVVSGKTYYVFNGDTYSPVSSPVDSQLNIYYEKASITWYLSYDNQTGVADVITDWTSVGSNNQATVYGVVDACFTEMQSYNIALTQIDSLNKSSITITQTLSTAFYTIDFQAGGKEIAFGAPANDDLTNVDGLDCSDKGLFKCNMDAMFRDKNDVVRMLFDFVYPVGSYYETSKSQAEFDPNVVWGGQWELEASGKFHMSAGTGWSLGATGGSPNAVVVKHNHTQNPHNHTQNAHHHIAFKYKAAQLPTGSSGAVRVWDYAHSGDSTANTNDVTATNIQQTATNNETGDDGTNKNLPPYIVVNRWHRTG